MIRDFANFLESKGCKVIADDDSVRGIIKSGFLRITDFELFFGNIEETGNLCITLFRKGNRYKIILSGEYYFTVTDSTFVYLCYRSYIGLSFNENLYAIIRFLLGVDSILLTRVSQLVEIRENPQLGINLARKDETTVHIENNYPNLDDYGRKLGYRIRFVSRDGFRESYYDVGLDLAKDNFDKFICPEYRSIVPMEHINGVYRNRYDRGNVKEIKDIRSLNKMLKVML